MSTKHYLGLGRELVGFQRRPLPLLMPACETDFTGQANLVQALSNRAEQLRHLLGARTDGY